MTKVRQEPRISANKLGEYLVASPSRRRTILQDQKYPDEFKVARYKEATQAISRFLAGGAKDLQILQKAIALLEATSPQTTFQSQDRELSIQALKAVISNHNQWSFSGLKLAHGAANVAPLTISGVQVSVRPEIVATSADKKGKLIVGAIKLHLPKTSRPNKDAAQYVTTLLHWHASERLEDQGMPSFNLCKLVDVHGGMIHDAPKAMTRRRTDIDVACQEIAMVWPHL